MAELRGEVHCMRSARPEGAPKGFRHISTAEDKRLLSHVFGSWCSTYPPPIVLRQPQPCETPAGLAYSPHPWGRGRRTPRRGRPTGSSLIYPVYLSSGVSPCDDTTTSAQARLVCR